MGGITLGDVLPIILAVILVLIPVVCSWGVAKILRTKTEHRVKRISLAMGKNLSLEIECYEVPDPSRPNLETTIGEPRETELQ
ncbi:hypothetical protein Pve01_39950 [Planomonospora venezuelensis]|uniref:Uncharacterized protein n=1 Tax=Planomonospora venezuelensis TaxID=1999 RepID=A0A841DDJ2_PLAVE|nr:hypothetical protein [Planomonospora venezuelensis]GIN02337.1 hypothetical protein Pve01_39950 [Planomonospora venezuelensis]